MKKSRFHALLDFKENFSYLNELVGLLLAQMFLLKVAQKVKKCIHWNNLTMRSIDASGIFEYWSGSQSIINLTLFIARLEVCQIRRTISRQRTFKKSEKFCKSEDYLWMMVMSFNLHRKAFFLSTLFALLEADEAEARSPLASLRSSSNIAFEALQTEWLANRVRMSFRKRRLK